YTPKAATSDTLISTTNMASYVTSSPNGARHSAVYPIISTDSKPYPQQFYATPSAIMPPSTTATSYLPPLTLASSFDQSLLMAAQTSILPQDNHPTYVTNSQEGRNILSTTAPATGSGSTNSQIPLKDANGRFPCLHCTKTFKQKRYLARHMLRHTGDRPYTCVLCQHTFSRSDILKRHFRECSIRRGNPTGATHLSHSRASQAYRNKKVQPRQNAVRRRGNISQLS
ncbi:hypothetical protein QBC32DRAFT_177817, partial [Pseudoneurospora amorphoporcata]